MKASLKSLILASALFLSGAALANAGSVSLAISNGSSKTINVDNVSCTGCTTVTATSISSGGSGTSTATSNSGVTAMTYQIDYYAFWGTSFTKKGCRALINLTLDGTGLITAINSKSWTSYASNPTCTTTSTATITGGGTGVSWGVRYNAS